MPVPQGEITTTETMSGLVPEQEAKKDDKQVPSSGQGESGVQSDSVGLGDHKSYDMYVSGIEIEVEPIEEEA
jgi:hypothetical protein